MERRRGLNFGGSLDNERVVGTDPPVVCGVLLAVPPRAPAGTTCAYLRVLAGVGRAGIETITPLKACAGIALRPDLLSVLRPQCTGCLQGARRTPASA